MSDNSSKPWGCTLCRFVGNFFRAFVYVLRILLFTAVRQPVRLRSATICVRSSPPGLSKRYVLAINVFSGYTALHCKMPLEGLDNLHEYLKFSYPKMRAPSFYCDDETESVSCGWKCNEEERNNIGICTGPEITLSEQTAWFCVLRHGTN